MTMFEIKFLEIRNSAFRRMSWWMCSSNHNTSFVFCNNNNVTFLARNVRLGVIKTTDKRKN